MPKPASAEVKQRWKENILKQRESGLSIRNWSRQNNISEHTFRYWQNKIFPQATLDRTVFKEISQQKTISFKLPKMDKSRKATGITIEYQGAYIYVNREVDISILRLCLKALKEISC